MKSESGKESVQECTVGNEGWGWIEGAEDSVLAVVWRFKLISIRDMTRRKDGEIRQMVVLPLEDDGCGLIR
jgi:hypothetical protein